MTLAIPKEMIMNVHIEKPEQMISVKVSQNMKKLLMQEAEKANMNLSAYIKLAIKERLEKDVAGA